MLSIKKYAAIDIGSNAVRLLISNITEHQVKPIAALSTARRQEEPDRIPQRA